MEILKLLSSSEIVAQIINFLLLFFILRIFFWKRLLKLLDKRKERIASEFKSIEESKKGIENLKSEYETKINSIEEIARIKLEETIAEGKRITDEIHKKAQLDAEQIIESAKQDLKYEIAKAKEEVKDKIIDLTIKTAESVIGEKLTEEHDRKLIEQLLEEIDKTK